MIRLLISIIEVCVGCGFLAVGAPMAFLGWVFSQYAHGFGPGSKTMWIGLAMTLTGFTFIFWGACL